MEERNCLTCRHVDLSIRQSPCKECVSEGRRYRYWEPDETEDEEKKEEKGKEDKDWKWPCFEKLLESVGEMGKNIEKGAKEIKLKKRPEMLAIPVPIYERTDSEIPEKVRISFTNGTSAIYVLHVDQPKPLVMESIRIIRKWRREGYQYVPPRRRRNRK